MTSAVTEGVVPNRLAKMGVATAADEYFVRRATPDDREQLIRLISMMDNVPDAKARYDWLYASNPHGAALSWVAVERRTNRAVACTSFFPRNLIVDGVLRRGAVGGDAFVEPHARRRGLATALHRASFASFDKGNVEFMYGPPYDHNLHALVKAGSHFIGNVENRSRLLSLPRLGRLPAYGRSASRQVGKTLPGLLTEIPRILRRPRAMPKVGVGAVTLSAVERFDGDSDRIFEKWAAGYRIIGVRDSEYLHWRYLSAPRRRQIPFAAKSSGKLIGWVALEIFRDHVAIIDLVTIPSSEFIDDVLEAAIAWARAQGCCLVTAACVCGSPLSRHLDVRGFRQAKSLGFQVAVSADHPQRAVLLEPTAWHFTLADGDMDVTVHGP